MTIKLLGCTVRNPLLVPSDLPELWQVKGTFAENLIEFAGRVCYRSTEKMGHAPGFIQDRIKEGHEDIIEHVVAAVRFPYNKDLYHLRNWNRHANTDRIGREFVDVSANLRVWRDVIKMTRFSYLRNDLLAVLAPIAPAVFADQSVYAPPPFPEWRQVGAPFNGMAEMAPVSDGPMRVTLLGYLCGDLPDYHCSATFLFEGISRACTHQLVRHRLASFSQESQRYVELSKGGWKAIVPPFVEENPAALAIMQQAWAAAEDYYRQLRDLGTRKEDARFLLPNATETRIVVTMDFAAWSHFFWLRAVDKAAQWEIRKMGQHALKMLHAVAPGRFSDQWVAYLKMRWAAYLKSNEKAGE